MRSLLIITCLFFGFTSAHAVSTKNCPETFYVSAEELSVTSEISEMMKSLSLEDVFVKSDWVSPVRISQITYASKVAKGDFIGGLMVLRQKESGVCRYVNHSGLKSDSFNYFVRIHGPSRAPKLSLTYSEYLDHGLSRIKFYFSVGIKSLEKKKIDAVKVQSVKIKTESNDVEWGSSELGSAQLIKLRYQEPYLGDN